MGAVEGGQACAGADGHPEFEDLLAGEAENHYDATHLQEDVGGESAGDGLLASSASKALGGHGFDVGGGEILAGAENAGARITVVVLTLQAQEEAEGRHVHILRRKVDHADLHAPSTKAQS